MTLIKLDSGDYINTGNVTRIYTVNCMDLIGDRGFHDEIRASFGSTSTEITPADRDRIVEAMGVIAPADADYDIHTDSDGNQYQLLTGRELIAGLADDAMQDEPIGDSYPNISEIIPDVQYKAYLDGNAGGLNGEWEEV